VRFASCKPDEILVKDDDPGAEYHFEAYAADFGVKDNGGDVIHSGAFKRTLDHRMPSRLIKVWRNHTDPVGMPVQMYEDDRGLYIRGWLNLSKQAGRDTLTELRAGELAHMSFAYDIVRDEWDDETSTLHLHELKLFEVGPVYWPMNESATVLSVKAVRDATGIPFESPLSIDALVRGLEASVADALRRGAKSQADRREVASALARFEPLTKQLQALRDPDPAPDATPAEPDSPSDATALALGDEVSRLLGALDHLTASLAIQA
jgi:HK97 family phage prohead protease